VKYIAEYTVEFAGGTCTGSFLLPGPQMPEVGDVVRLPVKGNSIPVRVKSVRLGGEHFGIQHVELICSMDVLSQ
jgi:hypothetical protein